MNDEEKYLFDLQGWIVVEDVLDETELAEMNALLDRYDLWNKRPMTHADWSTQEPVDGVWRNGDHFLTGGLPHTWEPPFRRMLTHPRLTPYLEAIIGPKYRFDHGHALLMRPGGDRLGLHGGGTPWDGAANYVYKDGEIHAGLVACSIALTDALPGQGGFAAVAGSHKANFAVPDRFKAFDDSTAIVQHVAAKAGSMIIFTEALTHGTYPWRAAHERRVLMLKYSPGHSSWAKWYPTPDDQPEAEYGEAAAVLVPPYSGNRPDTLVDARS